MSTTWCIDCWLNNNLRTAAIVEIDEDPAVR